MRRNRALTLAGAQTLTTLFRIYCNGFKKKRNDISGADWLKRVYLFNN